jgi:hypothetical protein
MVPSRAGITCVGASPNAAGNWAAPPPHHQVVGGATRDSAYASAKLRVIDGSTGMPGPVVVDTVIFFK